MTVSCKACHVTEQRAVFWCDRKEGHDGEHWDTIWGHSWVDDDSLL